MGGSGLRVVHPCATCMVSGTCSNKKYFVSGTSTLIGVNCKYGYFVLSIITVVVTSALMFKVYRPILKL